MVAHAIDEATLWNKLRDTPPQSFLFGSRFGFISNRWSKPPFNVMKCNMHISWINDSQRCGGACIIRDHFGDAVFHARDMFLPVSNRIAGELRGFIWVLQSLRDLHLDNIEIWSDCNAAIKAILEPLHWPRYASYLNKIHHLVPSFGKVSFQLSSPKANRITRDIATSVTRDGRSRSYLARGGPSWLLSRLEEEKRR